MHPIAKPLAFVLLLVASCGSRAPYIPQQPGQVDAPYELQSDDDLLALRQHYDALPTAENPMANRRELAGEYTRRIHAHLDGDQRKAAFENFQLLLSLWTDREYHTGAPGLKTYAKAADRIRKVFSKSGDGSKAVTALVALTYIRPKRAATYRDEVQDILQYSDELEMSHSGPIAEHAGPIEILEQAIANVPDSHTLEALLALYIARQNTLQSAMRRNQENPDLLQIHGEGALHTVRNIVAVLLLNGRIQEALSAIAPITGVGDDAEVRKQLQVALADTAAQPWIALADLFESLPTVALRFCEEAIARAPGESAAYLCAAEHSVAIGNTPLAIRFYEEAHRISPLTLDAAQALALAYESQVSAQSYGDRPNAALRTLRKFETFHRETQARLGQPLKPDLASAYAEMAIGLVSLGDLKTANSYLQRSLAHRTNLFALEYLGTVSLRQGRYSEANEFYEQIQKLPQNEFIDKFNQLRVRRLKAEAQGKLLGQVQKSEYEATVASWIDLAKNYQLPVSVQVVALVEMGKMQFELGQQDVAVKYFLLALRGARGTDPSSAHGDIVAFLVNRGAYAHARDFLHDALGDQSISEYFKIYMSLWVLAEGKRAGHEPEFHAMRYLKSRTGELWSKQLAHYIAHGGSRAHLESMATTRGRRAELLYYSAVLGAPSNDPAQATLLLQEVVRGSMVLFFEYEMATRRLSAP